MNVVNSAPTGISDYNPGDYCDDNDEDAAAAADGVTVLAVINLPHGSACDEINERRYCSGELVCHRCDATVGFRCVRCE